VDIFYNSRIIAARRSGRLITTIRIIKTGSVKNNKFPKVIISENKLPPFSFFPYVVIPAEDYKNGNYNDILDHESHI
jgi:hypothetical protein